MNHPASDWLVLIRPLVAGVDSTPDTCGNRLAAKSKNLRPPGAMNAKGPSDDRQACRRAAGFNDGYNRLYLACADGRVYELTRICSVWSRVNLGYGANEMKSISLGDAHNDGSVVVCAAGADTFVYEFSWVLPRSSCLGNRW